MLLQKHAIKFPSEEFALELGLAFSSRAGKVPSLGKHKISSVRAKPSAFQVRGSEAKAKRASTLGERAGRRKYIPSLFGLGVE